MLSFALQAQNAMGSKEALHTVIEIAARNSETPICVETTQSDWDVLATQIEFDQSKVNLKFIEDQAERLWFKKRKVGKLLVLESPAVSRLTGNQLDEELGKFTFSGTHDDFLMEMTARLPTPPLGGFSDRHTGNMPTVSIKLQKPIKLRDLLLDVAAENNIGWFVMHHDARTKKAPQIQWWFFRLK